MNNRRNRGGKLLWLILPICVLLSLTWTFAAGRMGTLRLFVTDQADQPVSGLSVTLYDVADTNGAVTAEFALAGISASSLRDTHNNEENARTLERYVLERGIAGRTAKTSTQGRLAYLNLGEGIYLVVCQTGQSQIFAPFLVYMPTVINGQGIYEINSTPKTEPVNPSSPDPDPSPSPSPSPDPDPSPSPSSSPDPDPSPSPSSSPDPDPSPSPSSSPDPDPSPSPSSSPDPDPSPSPSPDPEIPQTGAKRMTIYALFGFGAVCVIAGIADLCLCRRKRDE